MRQTLTLALVAFGCSACSTTPADRVAYGLSAVKLSCEAYERHPALVAELPPEAKEELDAICPVVATAGQ